jgi:hypothetical protein
MSVECRRVSVGERLGNHDWRKAWGGRVGFAGRALQQAAGSPSRLAGPLVGGSSFVHRRQRKANAVSHPIPIVLVHQVLDWLAETSFENEATARIRQGAHVLPGNWPHGPIPGDERRPVPDHQDATTSAQDQVRESEFHGATDSAADQVERFGVQIRQLNVLKISSRG